MSFIDICGIAKTFHSPGAVRDVLRDVTLSVDRGEFVSIVGMMGSGKSTLLKIVSGLLAPDAGTITIDGEPVTGVRPDAAIVFQNYSLLPWFSALENVRLAVGAAFPGWTKERQRQQAARHLEAVGLGQALQRRPGQLSGGMRQRVAIARAFAIEPAILFLDEPFGALDALTRESLQQELSRLCAAVERPVTTIMISNSVEEALLLSDRILPMTRGPGASLGTPVAVALARPRSASDLLHDGHAARIRANVVASLTEDLERSRAAAKQARSARVVARPFQGRVRGAESPALRTIPSVADAKGDR